MHVGKRGRQLLGRERRALAAHGVDDGLPRAAHGVPGGAEALDDLLRLDQPAWVCSADRRHRPSNRCVRKDRITTNDFYGQLVG